MADVSKFATDTVKIGLSDAAYRTARLYRPVGIRVEYYDDADAFAWVDITAYLYAGDPLTIRYGLPGPGPQDLVAATGTCQFTLINTAQVGGGSNFSPSMSLVGIPFMPGWRLGAKIRVAFLLAGGGDRVKFFGKLASIDPDEGLYGPQLCRVICSDYMRDLSDAELREFQIQLGVSEAASLLLIEGALPPKSVVPINFDAGVDLLLAMEAVGPGQAGTAIAQDLMNSSFGFYFQRGDGIRRYMNRTNRTFLTLKDTFVNDDMAPLGLKAPSVIDDVYNEIYAERQNVTVQIDLSGLRAGYEPGTDDVGIPAGATSERWIEYSDPLDTANKPVSVTAAAFIAPVSGTDYVFNTQADGLGADVTSSMVVRCDAFVGSAKYTVTNTTGATAYRITLQVRAFALLRKFKPVEFRSYSEQAYGKKTLRLTMPYQSSAANAAYIADVVRGQYQDERQRVRSVKIVPDKSERLMAHAIEREPGDAIAVVGTVLGIFTNLMIVAVNLSVKAGGPNGLMIDCEWTTAPTFNAIFTAPWALGTGQLDNTTVLG